jgi:hypothetical protein
MKVWNRSLSISYLIKTPKKDARRFINMNWTEIVAAIITAIVGPLLVFFVTRQFWPRVGIQPDSSKDQQILAYGQAVAIRTCDGKYVTADLNNDNTLVARERHVKEWEVFKIVHAASPFSPMPKRAVHYGDRVALLATNNQNFVGAAFDSQLTAWVAHVEDRETFTLLRPPKSKLRRYGRTVQYGSFFALQASNGQNVRYNCKGDGKLRAEVCHVEAWETFVFIDPTHPQ